MFCKIWRCSISAFLLGSLLTWCGLRWGWAAEPEFPRELVRFRPSVHNPLFAGTGTDTWDNRIRERGFILHEGDHYYLWYTGYDGRRDGTKHLGLATSTDGIHWVRDSENPIYDKTWVEDMFVIRHEQTYYMFAEGLHDIAHELTSTDRRHWQSQGSLDIRQTSGQPLSPGPYGTPTVWIEHDTWYLLYERRDAGVWLAKSPDGKVWTNVQDEPVLAPGPEPYDRFGIAMNQVVKYQGRYYGYYHATAHQDWGRWSTNVAVSGDLVHWTKYPHNPIVGEDASSGILVPDGDRFRLYTMHPDVRMYLPE